MLRSVIEFAANAPRRFVLQGMPVGGVCAEIGVYKGAFSARILRTTRPRKLHLIDPWKFEADGTYRRSWYGGWKGGGQAHMDAVHAGVLARFSHEITAGQAMVHRATSEHAAATFADGYFDWVYVDGNHLHDYVRRDLEMFFPKVKPGGWIAGDDYGVKGWWDDGVTRAVDEFATPTRFAEMTRRNHQFLLRKHTAD